MFWKRMRPTVEQQWVEQLEAGEHSNPTLRLADQLRQTPPVAPPLPTAFQTELRNRLIDQHPARRQPLRLVMRLAWVALIVMLLISGVVMARAGLRYPVMQSTSTTPLPSVAQTAIGADQTTVIYDRAQLEWVENGKQISAIGESWYTADGKYARYQLTSAVGDLLLFYLDDGNSLLLPTDAAFDQSAQPITLLHRQDHTYGTGLLQAWQDPSMLLVSTPHMLRTVWPVLLYHMRTKQPACHNVFCVLGVTPLWRCDERQCRSEGEVYEWWRQITQVGEAVVDGRRLGNFELRYEASNAIPSEGKRRLQFDLTTFGFITLEVYEQEAVDMRIKLLATQTLLRSTLPLDFFQSVPAALEVKPRPTVPGQPSFQIGDITVDIVSVSPEPGYITEPTTITVQLGYKIAPALKGITLITTLWPVMEVVWGVPSKLEHKQTLQTEAGTYTVTIPIEPGKMTFGRWRLQVLAEETGSSIRMEIPYRQPQYLWCIDCLADGEVIAIDKVLRAGSKERRMYTFSGRTTLPNNSCIQTQLLADGEPVDWWPADQCASLWRGRWKMIVPLYAKGAPGKLTPGVTYSLRTWQRDVPGTEAVKEFADLAGEIN